MEIAIIGAGKIGYTVAVMLQELDDIDLAVIADKEELESEFTCEFDFQKIDAADPEALDGFVPQFDAVVNAGPYHLTAPVATACHKNGVAYFDFTEDTSAIGLIKTLGDDRRTTLVPQCGVAPGIINIIAADLINQFDSVRSVQMRVGALPQTATNRLKYYRTWSTAGLINQCRQPVDALEHGCQVKLRPLEGLETITIDGVAYEAFNTAGGAATMCQTHAGQVADLTYKTLRYPGHNDYLRFLLEDMNLGATPDFLEAVLEENLPTTCEDLVVLYVGVTGLIGTSLTQRTYLRKVFPTVIHDTPFTAVQACTAASMAAVVELWLDGKIGPGYVCQESIDFTALLGTVWGDIIYGG